jgi:predicted MPP superfamily phosphohydrolase
MHLLVFPLLAVLLLGGVYAWAVAAIPWCARHRRAVAAGLAAVIVVGMATRRAEMLWHVGSAVSAISTISSAILLTLLVAAAPLAALRAASWAVGRWRRSPASMLPASAPPAPSPSVSAPPVPAPSRASPMTRRQMIEAATGLSFLGATGSMMGWGIARGRVAFELTEVPVRIAGLPRALDGYVIAQISDIHTGANVGARELDEGLELVRRARPDLLVVTGDMVDVDAAFAPLFARQVAGVAPRDGVFACLGNHDYYAGAKAVAATLRGAGVRTLVNDGVLLRPGDGGGIALLGVDDMWSSRYGGRGARLDLARAAVPGDAPRVLLSHQPPSIDRWAGEVALQLSGHTHGGQINPMGLRPADLFYRYVAGGYQVGGTTLYVNRGFGTVGPPARVNAPPEVTRFVLVAA